jgi:hypothetical protein
VVGVVAVVAGRPMRNTGNGQAVLVGFLQGLFFERSTIDDGAAAVAAAGGRFEQTGKQINNGNNGNNVVVEDREV